MISLEEDIMNYRLTDREVKEMVNIFFKEISSGIYYVEKDRYYECHNEYVNTNVVIDRLNNVDKVAIRRLNGELFINTEE
jgi:hypothetical protein